MKSCCAIGCTNWAPKDNGVYFYGFLGNAEPKGKWIAAVKRENWMLSEYTCIWSAHFVNGKSDDLMSLDYVPSIFTHISIPLKQKRRAAVDSYCRRKQASHACAKSSRRADNSVELRTSIVSDEFHMKYSK